MKNIFNRKIITFFVITLLSYTLNVTAQTTTDNLSNLQISTKISSMPITFTANQGQWDEKVTFRANAGRATMWFASDGAYYQFTRTIETDPMADVPLNTLQNVDSVETMMIKAHFVGSNQNPVIRGLEEIDYKCNYFIGNDKSKWATDVPNYSAVMYEEIYSGINLKYFSNGQHMEYDFIVEPGADFSQIKIQYEGVESISVNENGELVVTTMWGEVVEQRPVIYQVANNRRIPIDGSYLLKSDNSFSFELKNYDSSLPLVIDPVLEYSTYLGRSGSDNGFGLALDNSGGVYITGSTSSTNFPTRNSYQGTYQGGEYDGFVCKLSNSGDSLIYSTYLGSSGFDWSEDIAVDELGSAYLTGRTYSADFPTLNPIQDTHHDSSDIFVAKLNSIGDSLIYSTYLGGSNQDYGYGITVDSKGSAYIIGFTSSIDFPMSNAFQDTIHGEYDVVVCKLSSLGDSLIYSTYLGGSEYEYGRDIKVDDSGIALVIGTTGSPDFPIFNPYQSEHQGGSDVFITKLSSLGDSLKYSSYFGGASNEGGYAITQDDLGVIYITGMVSNNGFPTVNSYQDLLGGYTDGFLSKLTNSGTNLEFSTYFGGSHYDWPYGIALDSSGSIYVTGRTKSSDFPTFNSYQAGYYGDYNAFLFKFSDLATGIEEFDLDNLPSSFNMSQNYPNPFNPSTTIEFNLPTKSNVTINIYNLLGQQVQQLVNQEFSVGNYSVKWDGTSTNGVQVATGIYLYRLETENFVETKKMLLLK